MSITCDDSFKYNIEKLDSTSDEFKFIKDFHTTTHNCDGYMFPSSMFQTKDSFCIYKVNENNPIKAVNEKRPNLMLFHGTNKKGVTGILKDGFKNSKRGWFGQGVYLTDCSFTAQTYCKCYHPNDCGFIIVNEILGSEKLQTFEYDRIGMRVDIDTELKNPFNKHIAKSSPQPTKRDYKEDLQGRLYRNVAVHGNSQTDEYVADESVTIPRYIIVLEQKRNETIKKSSKLVFIFIQTR